MTAYIVAQLKFTNLDAYRTYERAFPAVFAKFNGTLLIADERVRVLEGDWERDKMVVLSFPSEEDALTFQNSPEYQAIAVNRKAGADATVLLVRHTAFEIRRSAAVAS